VRPRDKRHNRKHQVPPAAKTAARPEKVPRIGEDVDFWNSHPVWSFSLLDLVAQVGGWIHLQQDELDELLARFRQWEKMTWKEILAESRKQNHPIDVSKCSSVAQERLRVLKLDDQAQLMSLSVNSRARVIGILDRGIFRILWWDRDHQVCPSHMKHT
jgi:hypothetical protein